MTVERTVGSASSIAAMAGTNGSSCEPGGRPDVPGRLAQRQQPVRPCCGSCRAGGRWPPWTRPPDGTADAPRPSPPPDALLPPSPRAPLARGCQSRPWWVLRFRPGEGSIGTPFMARRSSLDASMALSRKPAGWRTAPIEDPFGSDPVRVVPGSRPVRVPSRARRGSRRRPRCLDLGGGRAGRIGQEHVRLRWQAGSRITAWTGWRWPPASSRGWSPLAVGWSW